MADGTECAMSCFNCISSKKASTKIVNGGNEPRVECTDDEVDESLFAYLDEYELPFYCLHYKFKKES